LASSFKAVIGGFAAQRPGPRLKAEAARRKKDMASKPMARAETNAERRQTSSRPVDLVHLSRYTLGDLALEREVLRLFCTQSFLCLDQLRVARSGKDWIDAAHSLKGSARAIGAWGVADSAERAERLGDEDMAQGRSLYIDEIDSALRAAHVFIASLLSDR
jgi:HPt (histidine-containing phosphotransfer) domain-containing protein